LQCADRDAVVAQVRVVVVLDDQPVVLFGPVQERRAAPTGEHRAGRKLVGGGHHDGAGVGGGEGVEVEPIAVHRHGNC
jgi:hypothetical protein